MAAGLGLPRRDCLVTQMDRLLRVRNQDDDFHQALVESARSMDGEKWTVDYGKRRRPQADLALITDGDWQWACRDERHRHRSVQPPARGPSLQSRVGYRQVEVKLRLLLQRENAV